MTIRATGNDPDGIVLGQRLAGDDRWGGEPVIFHRLLQHGGSIVYRQGNGLMGNNIGVIIADEARRKGVFIAGSLCLDETSSTRHVRIAIPPVEHNPYFRPTAPPAGKVYWSKREREKG